MHEIPLFSKIHTFTLILSFSNWWKKKHKNYSRDSEFCYHLNSGCNSEELLLYTFQTWQIHTGNKRMTVVNIYLQTAERLEVWLSQQAFLCREEQTLRTRSQPSSGPGQPAPNSSLSGFQFGFGDKCRGQAALGLCLQPAARARAVVSHLGLSRRGFRPQTRDGLSHGNRRPTQRNYWK